MQDLAARLARGEESAFAELYDQCAERLARYAAARLGRDAAADVVQTVMFRAVRSRRRFAGVETPAAYVFQIAKNEVARQTGKAKRAAGRLERELPELTPDAGGDDRDAIESALSRLDDADREIVEFKVYGGLTFREIAAVVGRPANTGATRYRRALESLRGWLAREFSPNE